MVVAMPNDPLLVDDDHRALGAQARREGAVGLCHRLVNVRKKRHVERVLAGEVLVRREILRGDADDSRVQRRKVLRPVALGAELLGAELLGADHRVVAGTKTQNDPLAPVL